MTLANMRSLGVAHTAMAKDVERLRADITRELSADLAETRTQMIDKVQAIAQRIGD